MSRITKNLSLDDEAAARGERYSRLHGMSLSRLVSDLLLRLPGDGDNAGDSAGDELPPAVRRLYGVARDWPVDVDPVESYRHHLIRKYGGR